MGTLGTVFHACCLLETTTFAFPYKDVAHCPACEHETAADGSRFVRVRTVIVIARKGTCGQRMPTAALSAVSDSHRLDRVG